MHDACHVYSFHCTHIQPDSPSLEHRIENKTQLLEFFNLGLQRDLNHNSEKLSTYPCPLKINIVLHPHP